MGKSRASGVTAIVLLAAGSMYYGYWQNSRKPTLFFAQANLDLGKRIEGDAVEGVLMLRNVSDREIEASIDSSCGCLVLTDFGPSASAKIVVPAEGNVQLPFKAETMNRSGTQYAFVSAASGDGHSRSTVVANIAWTVTPNTKSFPATVMFGELRAAQHEQQSVVIVQATNVPRFDIDHVEVSNQACMSVDVTPVTESQTSYAPGLVKRAELTVRYTAPDEVLQSEQINESIVIHPKADNLRAVTVPVHVRLLTDVQFSPARAVIVGGPGTERSINVDFRLGGALEGQSFEVVQTPPGIDVHVLETGSHAGSVFEIRCTLPEGPSFAHRRTIEFRAGERTIVYPVMLVTQHNEFGR